MRAARHLSREFVRSHPDDAAAVLERLRVEEASALLEEMPSDIAAAGLGRMVATTAADCLARISERRAAAILAHLAPDVAIVLLLRLAAEDRERLLAATAAKAAKALRQRLRFRKDTAGALVDPQILSFPDQIQAAKALSRLRHSSPRPQHYIYVVDRDERLLGALTLHQLMVAPQTSSLASIMNPHVARLPATADRATILEHEGWSQQHALAVVDDSGRFLGILSHDTMRRLQQDEDAPRGSERASSIGLAFADLCWIGMTKVVGAVAMAALRTPPPPGPPEGDIDGR